MLGYLLYTAILTAATLIMHHEWRMHKQLTTLKLEGVESHTQTHTHTHVHLHNCDIEMVINRTKCDRCKRLRDGEGKAREVVIESRKMYCLLLMNRAPVTAGLFLPPSSSSDWSPLPWWRSLLLDCLCSPTSLLRLTGRGSSW